MIICRAFLVLILLCIPAHAADEGDDIRQNIERALDLAEGSPRRLGRGLAHFNEREDIAAAPAYIDALRFAEMTGNTQAADRLKRGLRRMTGHRHKDWFQWMEWLEGEKGLKPFAGYGIFKVFYLSAVSEDFRRFLDIGTDYTLRLEEVAWGGVLPDGIPALDNPPTIAAAAASYLEDDEPVFGVYMNGEARAYPLRIMDWHEMANDVIGGKSISLAYCTLCGSAILYAGDHPQAPEGKPFTFGSSGLLYRSNKLMYDRATDSLWNHMEGKPVAGPLAASGIQLKTLPVVQTTWQRWRKRHPDTKVLSLDTGYERDYSPGAAYGRYFRTQKLMFPNMAAKSMQRPKTPVFVLRLGKTTHTYVVADLPALLNDMTQNVVLISNSDTQSVRAYQRNGLTFAFHNGKLKDGKGRIWSITEEALKHGNQRLARLPGHLSFAFAANSFLEKPEAAP